MNNARRHLIYQILLDDCLDLHPQDAAALEKVCGVTPAEAKAARIVSMPSKVYQLIAASHLSSLFDGDLSNIPGFFYDYSKNDSCVAWRINLQQKYGLLKPYTDERGWITGLYIYRSPADIKPRLLTSRGLTLGSEPLQPQPLFDRSLAA